MLKKIDSLNNPFIKETAKLKLEKYRKERNEFLIEGFHLLEMAKDSNLLKCVFTTKELNLPENIDQILVNESIINKLSFMSSNQGVIAICSYKQEKDFNDNLLVYLDDIKDPGNLGTILRTCLAFNIKNVLVSPNCVSQYNDKVVMASQGAIFYENVVECNVEKLKDYKKDYHLIATTLNSQSVFLNEYKVPSSRKIVVFGNESMGISSQISELCDDFVKIKISNIDSFNVGVAAGIVLYELTK
jgi:TrmH family RNA methyltransferase